jgi:hypothetical protein
MQEFCRIMTKFFSKGRIFEKIFWCEAIFPLTQTEIRIYFETDSTTMRYFFCRVVSRQTCWRLISVKPFKGDLQWKI